jgi:protein Mpv17
MAQQGVERRGLKNHELARTGRMALYGGGISQTHPSLPHLQTNPSLLSSYLTYLPPLAAIFGPGATIWYSFLQRHIIIRNSPSSTATIVTRVAMDQFIFTPTNMLVFLSSMAWMEGTSIKKKLESTYKTAIVKNWYVWPWVQLVNFKLVPLEHRVLVVNVVALGWNCYLSWLNSQGSK